MVDINLKTRKVLDEIGDSPSIIQWVTLLNIYEKHKKEIDPYTLYELKEKCEECRVYWNQDRIVNHWYSEPNGTTRKVSKFYKGLDIKPGDIIPSIYDDE